MGKTIYRGILLFFIAFWVCFILLDYWQHHPNYAQISGMFQYIGLFVIFAVMAGLSYFALFRSNLAQKIGFLKNGLGIFGLCLLLILISMLTYLQTTNSLDILTAGGFFSYLGKIILTAAEIFLIIWSAHSFGTLVNRKFFHWKSNNSVLAMINIVTGIMLIVYLAFAAAFFNQLKWFVVLPIFLLPLLLNYKDALQFLKFCTIEPLNISGKLNALGYVSFFMLLWLASMNFVQILGPMPLGWDSLTLYANLPNLLHDYQGLVNGYQPYNWSLFMSLGLVGFGSTELMLALSYFGGILSLFALYGITRNYFNTDVNFTLFGLLIFYSIPSVGLQSFLELKVDLGLLFALLCAFAVFLDWLNQEKEETTGAETATKPAFLFLNTKNEGKYTLGLDAHFILLGLISGFAFGIKFTTLFSFFALLAGIWFVLLNSSRAFLGMFLVCFAAMLIVKLDDFSGLRGFHQSVGIVQWLLFFGGLGLLGWTARNHMDKAMRGIRVSFLYGFFFFVPFLPWATKNYMETRQLSVDALLNGKTNTPVMDIRTLDKNLNQ